YCQKSVSLFLVSKTFERLCDEIFTPSLDDIVKAINKNHIFSMNKKYPIENYMMSIYRDTKYEKFKLSIKIIFLSKRVEYLKRALRECCYPLDKHSFEFVKDIDK